MNDSNLNGIAESSQGTKNYKNSTRKTDSRNAHASTSLHFKNARGSESERNDARCIIDRIGWY